MNTHKNYSDFSFVKNILIVCSVILLATGSLFAQKVWTLEDCINHALDNNIRIKQSQLDVNSSEISQLESKLDLLPSLNGGSSYSFGWGRSLDQSTYSFVNTQTQQSYFNLSSDVYLFNGFQKLNTIKQKRADYLKAKYSSDKIQNDVSLTVASYYLQILFSRELLSNARSQRDITLQQIERTRKLVDAGTLAKGSLLEVQAQGANEEVSVIQAENQLSLAMLDLMQLLEMEAGAEFQIDVPQLKVGQNPELLPVQMIYNKAVDVMPEVKSAEMQLESSTRGLAIAKGSRSPSITMASAYGTSYSDQIRMSNNPLDPDYNIIKPFDQQFSDNRNITLSFRLNIPIFNGYQISSYIDKSKISVLNSDYNLQLVKNTLRKNVETAYADASAAHSTFTARNKSLISLRESFNYTEQKFNVGMVNAVDYNIAKTQLSKAESDLLSSKYDYIFKLKILDFYLGRALTLSDMKEFMD